MRTREGAADIRSDSVVVGQVRSRAAWEAGGGLAGKAVSRGRAQSAATGVEKYPISL